MEIENIQDSPQKNQENRKKTVKRQVKRKKSLEIDLTQPNESKNNQDDQPIQWTHAIQKNFKLLLQDLYLENQDQKIKKNTYQLLLSLINNDNKEENQDEEIIQQQLKIKIQEIFQNLENQTFYSIEQLYKNEDHQFFVYLEQNYKQFSHQFKPQMLQLNGCHKCYHSESSYKQHELLKLQKEKIIKMESYVNNLFIQLNQPLSIKTLSVSGNFANIKQITIYQNKNARNLTQIKKGQSPMVKVMTRKLQKNENRYCHLELEFQIPLNSRYIVIEVTNLHKQSYQQQGSYLHAQGAIRCSQCNTQKNYLEHQQQFLNASTNKLKSNNLTPKKTGSFSPSKFAPSLQDSHYANKPSLLYSRKIPGGFDRSLPPNHSREEIMIQHQQMQLEQQYPQNWPFYTLPVIY
ncbi:hypothetical protein PPERSA_10252 [Pseudocohnilembus persalinus]|uniref:Uncharacterized protein n=1 Tax=Pseudocohnilembus persalinus TaxID=266149 RepID=A0A0V0R124_PSEPJ|nr:hypothetical protein PPERSA_10252 [Pseudocohnilembus persalinus]|eukprot:KRX07864.1 hypothetical protein PPERSA_10252 [Pseudocohnilembus persalinus]